MEKIECECCAETEGVHRTRFGFLCEQCAAEDDEGEEEAFFGDCDGWD
jgi:hypothetical protein